MNDHSKPKSKIPFDPRRSGFIVDKSQDSLSLKIAPLNFLRYAPGMIVGIIFGGLPIAALIYVVCVGIEHGDGQQVSAQNEMAGTLCVSVIGFVFFAAGSICFLVALSEASTRSELTIRQDKFFLIRKVLFSSRKELWPLNEIKSLTIVDAEDENYPGQRFHVELRLRTPGHFRHVASDRSLAEAEWIIETIRPRLQLDESAVVMEPVKMGEEEELARQTLLAGMQPGHALEIGENLDAAVVCTQCDSVYRASDRHLNCQSCGASLVLQEEEGVGNRRRYVGSFAKLEAAIDATYKVKGATQIWFASSGQGMLEQLEGSVECGWCEAFHEVRPKTPNCSQCGGVLPLPPSFDAGPQPPAMPRSLPFVFIRRMYLKLNRMVWVSLAFLVCAFGLSFVHWIPASLLGVVGVTIGYLALIRPFRRHLALRYGRPVLGRIESVHCGKSKDIHNLYRVYYRFDLNGEPVRGVKWTYCPTITQHFVGEPVWVVVVNGFPRCNDVWPPFN